MYDPETEILGLLQMLAAMIACRQVVREEVAADIEALCAGKVARRMYFVEHFERVRTAEDLRLSTGPYNEPFHVPRFRSWTEALADACVEDTTGRKQPEGSGRNA